MRSGRRAEVVLVRHGETEWSLSRRHTGRTDLPLTDGGRAQARRLAARLAAHSFGRVLTSPLARALETCELAGLGGRAEARAELMEWDYGEYEGRTTADIRSERPGWTVWRDGCPGGETADELGARLDPIVGELLEASGDVAIFGHGHALRVLAARWIGLPAVGGERLALTTAALGVLGYERETPVVQLWNETIAGEGAA